MTASVITFPKQRRFTPVSAVLPVLAPGNVAIEGKRAKIAIIRRLDPPGIRKLSDELRELANHLESQGGAA